MSKLRVILLALSAATLAWPVSAAAQSTGSDVVQDTAQVALQSADVTPDGRLTFGGHGFGGGESTSVTVEDVQGSVQARLESVKTEADGHINTVSASVPGGLTPGPHILRLTGQSSGRFGHAVFQLKWQPPAVHLDGYAGKPTHTFGFSGSGFVPGEPVDIYLGSAQDAGPLATVAADGKGDIGARNIAIPPASPGDYSLAFVGRSSQTPVSVGFNVQAFQPWAVLDNYYIAPQAGVGFSGVDFVPGEVVQVFLNTRLSQPVAQVTADADGRFAMNNAFALPTLSGNNQLIFIGQQSQAEVSTTFTVATPPIPTPE